MDTAYRDSFECAGAPAGGDEDNFECANADGSVLSANVWDNFEAENLSAGRCPSCGSEFYGDSVAVAADCPCCGKAKLVPARLSGMLKPEYIIPFKHDNNAAIEALKKFCNNKPLLPNDFTANKQRINAHGVYVPIWLFNAEVYGQVKYDATYCVKQHKHARVIHNYILRDGTIEFKDIPADASQALDDDYTAALEPFDYSEIKDFSPSYLTSYIAEKYDLNAKQCKQQAGRKTEATFKKELAKTIHDFNNVTPKTWFTQLKKYDARYCLFPVWIFNTEYNDKDYRFMMNGQTGKFVGKLPVDKSKTSKFTALSMAIFFAVVAPLLYLVALKLELPPTFTIPISIIASVCGGFLLISKWKKAMNTMRRDKKPPDYMVPGSIYIDRRKNVDIYRSF